MAILACSCSEEEFIRKSTVTVTLVDGDGYTAEESQIKVSRGEDAVFRLIMEEGMHAVSCSYEDSEIAEEEDCTLVLLYSVMYPSRVSVETRKNTDSSESDNPGEFNPDDSGESDDPDKLQGCIITYDINGGEFADGSSATTYTVSMLPTHKRINTSTAYGIIFKEGCTQTGWNTEPDGSGEHIGLGSRVTFEEGLVLYAEWAEWTSSSKFKYETETSGNISITGYSGSKDTDAIIVPGEIDGITVDRIGAGFAENVTADYLILPASIEKIEKESFANCTLNNIFFSDTLEHVYNASFDSCIVHSVHINAVRSPAHLADNDNTRFADDIDNIILYDGKPRLLFYAGCSMPYGLKSELVQEAYPQYQVLDLGVMAGTNAYFQMQIISRFLLDGDVFVHAPEGGSPYQIMSAVDTDSRVFTLVEGNYDLLSYADVADMELFWQSYAAFIASREKMDPVTYEDTLSTYNDYGDIIIERPYDENMEDKSLDNNEIMYLPELLTDEAFERLSGLYKEYTEKGVRVLFSFNPFNSASLFDNDRQNRAKRFETYFLEHQNKGSYEVISQLYSYIYSTKYFYDTDYHLNDEGARVRTLQLIQDLSGVL
ncbi:MAG: leucine-rich repeat domain-containing protein [Clostridia bacterium]|nr:leucine-rich repeat domain-containing protein [Clostridia bacterium]